MTPERKAAIALGAAAVAVLALMPLVFHEAGLHAPVSAGTAGDEAPEIFRPRAKKGAAAGDSSAEASVISAAASGMSASSADPALLALGKNGRQARGARGGRGGGGNGAAGAGAGAPKGPPADPRQAAAAFGLSSVPPDAGDARADELRDWKRLSLDPFSHSTTVQDGGDLASSGSGGADAGADSGSGRGFSRSGGNSAEAAGAAARKIARGGAAGGGGIDLSAAQAALSQGGDAMRKSAACLETTRAKQEDIQRLTAETMWTANERARNRCPARPCGWTSAFCGEEKDETHPMFWWNRWACYCDQLTCRAAEACRGMDRDNCDTRRACDGPGASCPPSQCQ